MATTNLGRVRFNMRGDYNPYADPLYSLLDLVSDGGGSFAYINDTPSNEPTSSTSHWQQIASKGLKGDTGAKIVTAAWSGDDLLLTLDDASAVTLTGAKTTLKGDPGDISNIKVDGATKTKAAGVVDLTSDFARYALWRKTASGNPVSVYPVPESPLYPKVSGTFTQSGTGDPSPSNIRPITPWLASGGTAKVKRTGKNLLPYPWVTATNNGVTYTVRTDGGIAVVGTASEASRISLPIGILLPPGTYKLGKWAATDESGANFAILKEGEIAVAIAFSSVMTDTITLSVRTNVLTAAFYVPSGATINNIFYPQLEIGSVATTYEPYSGQEITLTAPQEIPAGWMDNEGNGQGTWAKKVFDGTEPDWVDLGAKNATRVFYIPLADKKYGSGLNSSKCSHFNNTHVMVDLDTLSADGLFSDYWWDAHLYFCYGTNATSLADFKAFLSAQYAAGTPVTAIYELATPASITPVAVPMTALPQIDRVTPRINVLTASTGQIELTYAKSPIRESDDISAAIAAL